MVSIEDTNIDCTLSMWDLPKFSAQIGTTQDIDIDLLNSTEKRILTAFGQMNTTFYTNFNISTQIQINRTIPILKMQNYYNLSVMWMI